MSDFDILNAISTLGKSEQDFLGETFVAPVVDATKVSAWVGRISHEFAIDRPSDPGWYQFKAVDFKRAKMVGPADIDEIESYLKKLKKVMLVVVMRIDGVYHAMPMKANPHGLDWSRLYPVFLTDDMVNDFDRVACRFDGANLWYERLDFSNDPTKADYLRDMFSKLSGPSTVRFPGLSFEERASYSIRVTLDHEARERAQKAKEALKGDRIKEDVEHAGGTFLGFREKATQYEVTYAVDGERYTSVVAKDSAHTLISAGICLSGGDREFDLASLITVVREGQHRGLIHRW